MKECICKENLISVIERNTVWNANKGFEELIKGIPTVTKVDICREIISNIENEVKATQVDYEEAMYRVLEYLETGEGYYQTLAEMECGE